MLNRLLVSSPLFGETGPIGNPVIAVSNTRLRSRANNDLADAQTIGQYLDREFEAGTRIVRGEHVER
jgi:hypothetical protein